MKTSPSAGSRVTAGKLSGSPATIFTWSCQALCRGSFRVSERSPSRISATSGVSPASSPSTSTSAPEGSLAKLTFGPGGLQLDFKMLFDPASFPP